MKKSRRDFLKNSILLSTGLSASVNATGKIIEPFPNFSDCQLLPNPSTDKTLKIYMFSKHFDWLNYEELAKAAVDIGFDGIDLTVRPNVGHVLPENVEIDLPKAVEIISKAGLEVKMISTSIKEANEPYTHSILKTAASLGISHYRMNLYFYEENISVEKNLAVFYNKLNALATLNKRYKIKGVYQLHSSDPDKKFSRYFGSTVWDMQMVFKKINSPWIGCQYDIQHANIEGAYSWPTTLELIRPYIKALHVKDHIWEKKDGLWGIKMMPIGEGMVDLEQFFALVKKKSLHGPITYYYGYPIGSKETGLDIDGMKKALANLKAIMKKAGLN